jgi:hypothetical protein
MSRIVSLVSLVIAVAALAVAFVSLRRADDRAATPGVLSDASISQLRQHMAHHRTTREYVRATLGNPASIYRDNPRAECWAYWAPGGGTGREQPYEIQMCFGPKRNLAWMAGGGPRRLPPPA